MGRLAMILSGPWSPSSSSMRGADEGDLKRLAQEALRQIEDCRYDAGARSGRTTSRVRWGIACCGKRVAVVVETVPGV